jgi:methanogenic corrinoid protein MtbC1
MITTNEHVEELLGLAAASDLTGAFDLVGRFVDAGMPVERVLAEVVVPVQRRVGELWESNAWTVAQEHATTAVIDAVVGQLAYVREAPPERRGRIVVVCAEGEWHALPARLIATGLGLRGWDVVFLGGSVPASHLVWTAKDGGWTAAVLSCSVAMFLPGALRSVDALHGAGLPVLATGRGFGPDRLRAEHLGADGWADDLASGDVVLDEWESAPPETFANKTAPPEVFALEAEFEAIVDRALAGLRDRLPGMATYSQDQLARTREDLDYLLRFLLAAVLTRDERILTEYIPWLERVLTSRGVPAAVVPVTLEAVQEAVPAEMRRAHDMLLAARRESAST